VRAHPAAGESIFVFKMFISSAALQAHELL